MTLRSLAKHSWHSWCTDPYEISVQRLQISMSRKNHCHESWHSWLRKRVRESAEVRDLKRQAANLEFCKCLWTCEASKPCQPYPTVTRKYDLAVECNFLFWCITVSILLFNTFYKSVMWRQNTSGHVAMSRGRLPWCVMMRPFRLSWKYRPCELNLKN